MDNEKEPSFDLDLLPVISVMSVCICFLLLTAVWTHIGSINVEQGLGQESSQQDAKTSTLWVKMMSGGRVQFTLMDSPEAPNQMKDRTFLLGAAGSGWPAVEKHAAELKQAAPDLKTALIFPGAGVSYGDVIRIMDELKGLEIGEIGIAPL